LSLLKKENEFVFFILNFLDSVMNIWRLCWRWWTRVRKKMRKKRI